MSPNSQKAQVRRPASSAIVAHRIDMIRGHRFERHTHPSAHQLIWTPSGVLCVEIGEDSWVLPTTLALWVPAGTEHVTHATGTSVLQGLYFSTEACPVPWAVPTVVAVDDLLRALLLHLDKDVALAPRQRAEAVVFDLLTPVSVTTITLPMPTDPRALDVASALVHHPADQRSLAAWGDEVGASARTLSRRFRLETGLTFGQWRTQNRLRAALDHLAAGMPIGNVAREVGYETASAFVASFRRATGQTPGAYFAASPR